MTCIVLFTTMILLCSCSDRVDKWHAVTDGKKILLAGVNIYLKRILWAQELYVMIILVKNMFIYEKPLYLGLLSVCALLGSCVEKNMLML